MRDLAEYVEATHRVLLVGSVPGFRFDDGWDAAGWAADVWDHMGGNEKRLAKLYFDGLAATDDPWDTRVRVG